MSRQCAKSRLLQRLLDDREATIDASEEERRRVQERLTALLDAPPGGQRAGGHAAVAGAVVATVVPVIFFRRPALSLCLRAEAAAERERAILWARSAPCPYGFNC